MRIDKTEDKLDAILSNQMAIATMIAMLKLDSVEMEGIRMGVMNRVCNVYMTPEERANALRNRKTAAGR